MSQSTSEDRCTNRAGTADTACRCSDTCREQSARANRLRKARVAQGLPGRVPAAPVARHIQGLLVANPTATLADIARASGVSRGALSRIVTAQPGRTVNTTTAARVASVRGTIHVDPDTATRPGVGTRRRVEALMWAGFPVKAIADAAGLKPSTLMPGNLDGTITIATATAVDKVYQVWRFRVGPSAWTANTARRRGYQPWTVWPDRRIDDPAARPDTAWATAS